MLGTKEKVVSRPRGDGDYAYRKEFYRDASVAADYDAHRFTSKKRRRRNAAKWRTIVRALEHANGVVGEVGSVLDIPCGTGRFTGHLAERGLDVVGCDISHEMMAAAPFAPGAPKGFHGYVQADAEALPLPDGAIDCVMSIRFFMHIDGPTRVRILREMKRVSAKCLVVDYRHRYTLKYAKWRAMHALGLTKTRFERVSREEIDDELRQAGLRVERIFPVTRVFSDKWIVVALPVTTS